MLKKSFYCLSLFILALGMAACGSKTTIMTMKKRRSSMPAKTPMIMATMVT